MASMSHFETVLIAALTSAAVALAIEWAAKPRLEARKDRILKQSRAKLEIELQLGMIVSMAASLDTDISTLDSSDRRIMLTALEERRTDVISASKAVVRALAVVALRTDSRTSGVIARTVGMTQGIALSAKLRDQAGKELATVNTLALELYHAPSWRIRKRRKLLALADLIFDSSDPPSS
jgi:hypothetical protein